MLFCVVVAVVVRMNQDLLISAWLRGGEAEGNYYSDGEKNECSQRREHDRPL